MKELEAVLIAFREGTHCEAAVWGTADGRSTPTVSQIFLTEGTRVTICVPKFVGTD